MESEKPDSLQLHFRRSVPVAFIDRLIRRQEWIYQEAHQQCFSNPLYGEPEAKWMLGYTERALFKSELRKAAIDSGLPCEDVGHNANNCNYVRVSAGNIRITAHRVPTPGSFVPEAESRKQDASVNQFLDEYIDEGLLRVPLPKIQHAKEIVFYILHGSIINLDGKKPFLEVATPDSELSTYRWNSSFLDLRQAYMADARKDATKEVEDKAKPKPKKDRGEGTNE